MLAFQTGAEEPCGQAPCSSELAAAPSSGLTARPSLESSKCFYLNYLLGNVGGASLLGILPPVLLESWVTGKMNLGEYDG